MKQCPVCKTTYTDDSLRFCLADGASLFSTSNEQETVQMSAAKNPLRIDIQKDTAPTNFPPVTSENQPKERSILPFIIAAVVGLLFLGIAGISVLVIINPFGKTGTVVVSDNSNSPKPTATPISTPVNQNDRLNEKLANLEKQIQDQKNQKNTFTNQTFPGPTQNNSSVSKARVAPSNDGFLSLRTEPSVKTGTQLMKIPSGATVNLENCEKNYVTIDGRRGRWCMVSYAGKIGWAFDAWLIY
jgi:hypothetical protein